MAMCTVQQHSAPMAAHAASCQPVETACTLLSNCTTLAVGVPPPSAATDRRGSGTHGLHAHRLQCTRAAVHTGCSAHGPQMRRSQVKSWCHSVMHTDTARSNRTLQVVLVLPAMPAWVRAAHRLRSHSTAAARPPAHLGADDQHLLPLPTFSVGMLGHFSVGGECMYVSTRPNYRQLSKQELHNDGEGSTTTHCPPAYPRIFPCASKVLHKKCTSMPATHWSTDWVLLHSPRRPPIILRPVTPTVPLSQLRNLSVHASTTSVNQASRGNGGHASYDTSLLPAVPTMPVPGTWAWDMSLRLSTRDRPEMPSSCVRSGGGGGGGTMRKG